MQKIRTTRPDGIDTVLFDLDGTIINSEEGITNCLRYVIDYWGMEQPPQEKLLCFIGPPLREQFHNVFGFDAEKTEASVRKYRERYDTVGQYECEVYHGVKELIHHLKQAGYRIALASSKPQPACARILAHFDLDREFDGIFGSTIDGRISTKQQVLEEVFEKMQVEPAKTILVGDTRFDVDGANRAHIPCIGVTYGFGDAQELIKAGAICICDTAKEVGEYLENT